MTLKIHNTYSGKKEDFIPINPNQILFYACGVTVYDLCHIGHARAYIAFDTIRRYLIHKGFNVKFVQNFTDIDDKIIARANERGISTNELTEENINDFFSDMESLNILPATCYPRATKYIGEMQEIIKKLIEDDLAYEKDGDVFFCVSKFEKYGKLSKKKMEDLIAGHRVSVSSKKDNPLDFVLWKKSKENEPSWESPWGSGRPGWHIECSAMAIKELGETIDIHTGGEDLIFPHHENEIAQSESYTKKPFVRYWIHNGFVNIDERKMSKSKKNFFTIKEVLKDFSGEVIRMFLLKVHYRSPLNFSLDGLVESKHALDKLYNTLSEYKLGEDENVEIESLELQAFDTRFHNAMDNDFNYAEAVGILFDLNRHIHKTGEGTKLLLKLGNILGLFYQLPSQNEPVSSEIEELIKKRTDAKNNRNYTLADEIRDALLKEHKVILEDTADGIRWKRA
jgi:cysteinyl-tRNA synthetase